MLKISESQFYLSDLYDLSIIAFNVSPLTSYQFSEKGISPALQFEGIKIRTKNWERLLLIKHRAYNAWFILKFLEKVAKW